MIQFKLILEQELLTTDVAQFVAATRGIGRYDIWNFETGELIVSNATPSDIIYFGDRNIYGYVFDYCRSDNTIVCKLFIRCYGDECRD